MSGLAESASAFDVASYMADRRAMVEVALEDALRRLSPETPRRLYDAMEYSLLGNGKRLRPILAIASAESVGASPEGVVLDFACAVEFIHTYSLIHDDLPAMDDDDLRRGRPTSHRVFGEALAILAGDALLTDAFGVLGAGPEPVRARLCAELARSAGAAGMVGGQADDVREDRPRTLEFVEALHKRKTGALIAVACYGGALAGGGGPRDLHILREYGMHVGLAFQIVDDLMDLAGDPVKSGKTKGSDARKGKLTYPSLLGNEESLRRARAEVGLAHASVEPLLPKALPLVALADYALKRQV
jgi:geranylgeranyl diphosphate synthase type II